MALSSLVVFNRVVHTVGVHGKNLAGLGGAQAGSRPHDRLDRTLSCERASRRVASEEFSVVPQADLRRLLIVARTLRITQARALEGAELVDRVIHVLSIEQPEV